MNVTNGVADSTGLPVQRELLDLEHKERTLEMIGRIKQQH